MSYGINIYNAANNIVVSQDFSNYQLVSSGTIADQGAWPSVAATDVMFLRANTAGAAITCQLVSSVIVAKVSAGLIEYVIVRRSPSPSGSNNGLRVYQSDGTTIAFDSGFPGAKIVSGLTRTGLATGLYDNYSTTISQPFAVPAGRKRYISASPFMYWSHVFFSGFFPYLIPYLNSDQVTWTSDMQQTVATYPPGMPGNKRDLFSTTIFLTIDI